MKDNIKDNMKDKIKIKPGWELLYYDKNKYICSTYIPSDNGIYNDIIKINNEEYQDRKRKDKIFEEYIKNVNEDRNIRKELYNEDFSYLDKYLEETYDIYTENDGLSSDLDSNDDLDYTYSERKYDT
jgi:hypothetical protein